MHRLQSTLAETSWTILLTAPQAFKEHQNWYVNVARPFLENINRQLPVMNFVSMRWNGNRLNVMKYHRNTPHNLQRLTRLLHLIRENMEHVGHQHTAFLIAARHWNEQVTHHRRIMRKIHFFERCYSNRLLLPENHKLIIRKRRLYVILACMQVITNIISQHITSSGCSMSPASTFHICWQQCSGPEICFPISAHQRTLSPTFYVRRSL